MNSTLNIHGNNKIQIPNGLQELICDISREVIRNQPTSTSMIQFIAEFIEAKLRARDVSQDANDYLDKVLFDASKDIMNYEQYGITEEIATEAATKIQILYRGYKIRNMSHELKLELKKATQEPKWEPSKDINTSINEIYRESVTSIPESMLYRVASKLDTDDYSNSSNHKPGSYSSLKSDYYPPGNTLVLTDLTRIDDKEQYGQYQKKSKLPINNTQYISRNK